MSENHFGKEGVIRLNPDGFSDNVSSIQGYDIPGDWEAIPHDSGLTIYYNKVTSVATLSQPFTVSFEEVKSAPIPVLAIPCLRFRYNKSLPKSSEYKAEIVGENESEKESDQEETMDEITETGETSEGEEKEEGELTSDEDDEGEESRQPDFAPPAKRLCSYNVDDECRSSAEMLHSKKVSEQGVHFRENAMRRLQSLTVLSPDELREYCSLFQNAKKTDTNFRNRWERQRHNRMKRAMQGLDEGESVSSEQRAKERIFRSFRRPPICILHEYCQSVLHVPTIFKSMASETEKQLFHYAVVVNDVVYPTGVGNSKKIARSEAARLALIEMLPEYKAYWKQTQADSPAMDSTVTCLSEADLNIFQGLPVRDRKIFDIVCDRQLNWAAPYAIFGEYVKRHCIPDSDIYSNMTVQSKNNHLFEIRFREHHVQVQCKNKRTGRNLAAQEILARLHPQVKTWVDLLKLYGPNTKRDKNFESGLIFEAQARQPNSIKSNLIRVLREKMLEMAPQNEATEGGKRKGKFRISPDDLPVVDFHPDSKTNVYSNQAFDTPFSEST
ncbi:hypothetical protein Aperf_G00000043313 [Anoplocephala perfoliata]